MKITIIFFISIFLFSCSPNQNKGNVYENDKMYIINLDDVESKGGLLYSSIFSKMKTIILETTDESLISMINKMEVYNDYIIILDFVSANSVFVFDKEGKFIRKIGAIGSGPGEFISPYDFTIDAETGEIYVLDLALQKVFRYNIISGKYLSTMNLYREDGSDIARICFANNMLYTDAAFGYESSYNYLMQAINPSSGKQEKVYFTAEYTNKGWYDINKINSEAFYHTGKRPLFNQHFMDTVISLTPHIHPFIIVKGKDIVTPGDMDKFVNTDFQKRLYINKIRNFSHFIEHNDFIFFRYAQGPSYKQILFNTKTKETRLYMGIMNDFIYKIRDHRLPRFGYSTPDGLYTYYDNSVDHLVLSILEGECSDKLDKKEELLKLDEDTNPVIFFFEYKD